MIKARVMPTLLVKGFGLVKGVRFDSWRPIGSIMQAVKVYNMREVDELVLLDIRATDDSRMPDFSLIDDIADECFMPLTVGGGIRSIDDVRKLLQVGADKIAINTAAVETPGLVSVLSEKFGAQCIVISIDAKKLANGKYEVFTHSATKPTGLDPVSFAQQMERNGAGEILLTSIDRDGTMLGYDLELIQMVSQAVSIPVIASGGAGNYQHMEAALTEANATAVAASSIFQFTQQTPIEAKRYLSDHGIKVRI